MKLSLSFEAFVSLLEMIKSLLETFYLEKKNESSVFILNFTFDNWIKPYLKVIYIPIFVILLTRLTHSRVDPFFQPWFKRFDQALDHMVIQLDLFIFVQLIISTLLFKFPDL